MYAFIYEKKDMFLRLLFLPNIFWYFLQPRPRAKRCAGDEVDLFIIFIDFLSIKLLLSSILLSY